MRHIMFVALVQVIFILRQSTGFQTQTDTSNSSMTYCVSQTSGTVFRDQLCFTFSEIIVNASIFFDHRNTTLLFLPGNHGITQNGFVQVQNVSTVYFIGVKQFINDTDVAIVSCNRTLRSGIMFSSIALVSLINITIANCGASIFWQYNTEFAYVGALYAFMVTNFLLQNCILLNSTYIGIIARNTNQLNILNSTFSGNCFDKNCRGALASYTGVKVKQSEITTFGRGIEIENGSIEVEFSAFSNNIIAIQLKNSVASLFGSSVMGIGGEFAEMDYDSGISCANSNLRISNSLCFKYKTCISARNCSMNMSTCKFLNNSCAIDASDGCKTFISDVIFLNHKEFTSIYQDSYVFLINATFHSSQRSCLFGLNSTLEFSGNSLFQNCINVGFGGAMYLIDSFMLLTAPAYISFINNSAYFGGGAIYTQTLFVNSFDPCFLQINDKHGNLSHPGVGLHFTGNRAQKGGSILYGNIIYCYLDYYKQNNNPFGIFKAISTGIDHSDLRSAMSSDAFNTCMCFNATSFDCSQNRSYQCYPGQTFSIVGLDLYGNTSPTTVVAYTSDFDVNITNLISMECKDYNCYDFVVLSGLDGKTMCMLTQSAVSQTRNLEPLCIQFKVISCPAGFTLNETSQTCQCNRFLLMANLLCNISDLTVLKTSNQWIGTISNSIVLYPNCPLDFCLPPPISISLDDPDIQCGYGRSGILCGACDPGLSMIFGSSHCRFCSNNFFLLHIITFAIMGVVLIASLLILNLTVSVGTINGLVFYANVIGINSSIIFTHSSWPTTHFLYTFIAWVNLDFGIETCFYDGMDSYAKIWLYLVFPAYIFIIVGVFSLAGNLCKLIFRVFKRNVVPVLATLLLLSFGKFAQLSIVLLSYAKLSVDLSNGEAATLNGTRPILTSRLVFDGNIEYLSYKHIPLFLIGLLVVILISPFSLLLLLSPCLLQNSHKRGFGWVNKLKPFIDSYHAPFNARYRFWPGALIAVRISLYIMVTLGNSLGAQFNFLGVIICCSAPLFAVSVLPVYKEWYGKVLEVFFYTNALLLSLVQLYFLNTATERVTIDVAILLTVGSAFCVTMGILLCHGFWRARELFIQRTLLSVKRLRSPSIHSSVECSFR